MTIHPQEQAASSLRSTVNWSTQQLAEFLALVSSCTDIGDATQSAVERAAEALEAEVGALITRRRRGGVDRLPDRAGAARRDRGGCRRGARLDRGAGPRDSCGAVSVRWRTTPPRGS